MATTNLGYEPYSRNRLLPAIQHCPRLYLHSYLLLALASARLDHFIDEKCGLARASPALYP